jgi:hypothetical protein
MDPSMPALKLEAMDRYFKCLESILGMMLLAELIVQIGR